jgi:hypothetical protein
MRLSQLRAWAACALLLAARPADAVAPVPLEIGPSRDGGLHDLQRKVDLFLGPGRLNVRTDFLGARAGDADPWSWLNPGQAIELGLVDRKSPNHLVGWYRESDTPPPIDGVAGDVVLDRWRKRGMRAAFRLPASVTRFGFFVTDAGPMSPGAFRHFSNRLLNAPGPAGRGAAHAPYDGDVQFLVYDVSRWLGPRTWLVAAEISDSGRRMGHGDGESDNDYSDVLFTVSGVGVTPTLWSSFGRVKRHFR